MMPQGACSALAGWLAGQPPITKSAAARPCRFHSTGLHEALQARGVRQLVVAGVATEYCVYWSVRDAVELGYEVGQSRHVHGSSMPCHAVHA